MSWVLVLLFLTVDGVQVAEMAEYQSMTDCFDDRERIVYDLGKPIINYQVVCIAKDFENEYQPQFNF